MYGYLTNVATSKSRILAINSNIFWKNGWQCLLYFCSTFKISSLACLLSLLFHVVCQLLLNILFFPLQARRAGTSFSFRTGACLYFLNWGRSVDYCLRAQHKGMTRSQRLEPDVLSRKKPTETSQLFLATCSWCSLKWLLFCFVVSWQNILNR